jgi:type I restriction enzyme S subunit
MEKLKNLPSLRFPEFAGNWDNRKIKEILTIGSGKDYKHLDLGDVPVFGTGGLMTMVNSYLYDGETVCIGRKGTIDKPMYFNGKIWTVDTLFYTHSFRESNPKFVFNLFQRVNWKQHNEAGGVPSLSKSTIEQISLNLPSLKEQTKIASFLSEVDYKLQTLKQKKKLLKQYKKGVMQKIFSQELRFKDDNGNDYPDWEEKKLGKICDVVIGGTPSTTKTEYWNGDIGWIGSGELKNGLITRPTKYITELGLKKSSTFLMPKGTTVLAMTGATIGKIGYLDFDTAGNQSVAGFLNLINVHSLFLFYQMQVNTNQILTLAGGAAQTGINKSNIESLKIQIPNLVEQNKIANFLSAIDDKINHCQAQIEKMEVWKKGLLQQMFV